MTVEPGEGARAVDVVAVSRSAAAIRSDLVVAEEPLEIRVAHAPGDQDRAVAVTMRTPGNDFELAVGFLYGEGLITRADELAEPPPLLLMVGEPNVIRLTKRAGGAPLDLGGLERHFFASSSCGVCGKAGLEQLALRGCAPLPEGFAMDADVLRQLPARLRAAQPVFAATGGLHAAALFDGHGELIAVREDVGRHNALDKLVGWALLERRLPLERHAVLVSGRASFEVLQKCLMARVPVVCAVSAPTSLAVSTAESYGMTLVGFLSDARFNVYAGAGRVRGA